MPRKKKSGVPLLDPTGTRYECRVHGDLGTDVIILNTEEQNAGPSFVYCPRDDCLEQAKLVGRAIQPGDLLQLHKERWNNNRFAKIFNKREKVDDELGSGNRPRR